MILVIINTDADNAIARQRNDGGKVWGTREEKIPPDEKRSTSGVISAAFGEKIKKCLKNPELFSKEFRHYVKKKKFRVFEMPSIDLKLGCFSITKIWIGQRGI